MKHKPYIQMSEEDHMLHSSAPQDLFGRPSRVFQWLSFLLSLGIAVMIVVLAFTVRSGEQRLVDIIVAPFLRFLP